jgi:hypothetical protein
MENFMREYIDKITKNMKKLLLFHYARMYLRILSSCLSVFGFGILFLYYLVKVPAMIIYINVSMFMDNIFFPKYRNVKIENPVFIFGHPRSGTTFLHTILTQTEDFLVFKNWDFNHPSLTAKKILQHSRWLQVLSLAIDFRLTPHRLKLAIKNRKDKKGGALELQKRKLDSITQEEEPLFLHILDTQFLPLVTPIGFVKKGYPELCFNDEQPHQEKSVLFLKNCFKRQIYYSGKKQIIAKMNFSLFRINTLLKLFPDAKIIYISRSPLETIHSHLSLQRRILDRYFGLENIPPDNLQQYYRHRYHYNLLFYKHYDELRKNNVIPEDRILEITYDSIKHDLWNVLQQIRSFANLRFRPELEDMLRKQDKEQASYERKHENLPLEAFNLTEEKIRSDFDFFFKRYGST